MFWLFDVLKFRLCYQLNKMIQCVERYEILIHISKLIVTPSSSFSQALSNNHMESNWEANTSPHPYLLNSFLFSSPYASPFVPSSSSSKDRKSRINQGISFSATLHKIIWKILAQTRYLHYEINAIKNLRYPLPQLQFAMIKSFSINQKSLQDFITNYFQTIMTNEELQTTNLV